jgi:hypothetical protein
VSAYKKMLRDIVRDHGAPETFSAKSFRLSDEQLATALQEYGDTLPEVAVEITEGVIDCLRFQARNAFVQMLQSRSHVEAIGLQLVSGCRNSVTPLVRRDLECTANEMELEDRTDSEHEMERAS